MKKKLSLVIAVLIFALSFTGCSNKDNKESDYDENNLTQASETIIGSFAQMKDQDFKQFTEGSELQVNLTLMQTGLPVDRDAFVSMIEAWQTTRQECGAYIGHDGFRVSKSGKELTVTASAQFEKRDADLTFVFDEQRNIKSLAIDAKYTTGEILKKAGLNTLLGMGTVFFVLILIAVIISLFKYIPGIQAKLTSKPVKETKDNTEETRSDDQKYELQAIQQQEEEDLYVAAAIAAAIAASLGTSGDGFVVRSIRRRPLNKWNQ